MVAGAARRAARGSRARSPPRRCRARARCTESPAARRLVPPAERRDQPGLEPDRGIARGERGGGLDQACASASSSCRRARVADSSQPAASSGRSRRAPAERRGRLVGALERRPARGRSSGDRAGQLGVARRIASAERVERRQRVGRLAVGEQRRCPPSRRAARGRRASAAASRAARKLLGRLPAQQADIGDAEALLRPARAAARCFAPATRRRSAIAVGGIGPRGRRGTADAGGRPVERRAARAGGRSSGGTALTGEAVGASRPASSGRSSDSWRSFRCAATVRSSRAMSPLARQAVVAALDQRHLHVRRTQRRGQPQRDLRRHVGVAPGRGAAAPGNRARSRRPSRRLRLAVCPEPRVGRRRLGAVGIGLAAPSRPPPAAPSRLGSSPTR